jgi:hypothetical protein
VAGLPRLGSSLVLAFSGVLVADEVDERGRPGPIRGEESWADVDAEPSPALELEAIPWLDAWPDPDPDPRPEPEPELDGGRGSSRSFLPARSLAFRTRVARSGELALPGAR